MRRNHIDASQLELNEKVVSIKRVTKVVKGGRHFRFTALVVVGDGKGHVGAGLGKAAEIPEAIRKGKEDAMKNIITVALNDEESITHDMYGKFGSATVLLKNAPEGTGVIAGGPCRDRDGRNQEYPYKIFRFQQQTERSTRYSERPEECKDTGGRCKTSRQIN